MRAVVDGDGDRTAHLPAGRLDPGAVGPGGDQAGGRDGARRFELTEDRGEPGQLPLERLSVEHPAAARACSSPLLWPATASGCRPSRVSTWKRAHWDESTAVTAVSVAQSASDDGSAGAEEMPARRNLLPRFEGDPIGRVEHRAELGEVRAEVGEHPRILRALAGEEERQSPPPHRAVPPRSRARGRRGPAGRRDRGASARSRRCRISSSCEAATMPSRDRPARPG